MLRDRKNGEEEEIEMQLPTIVKSWKAKDIKTKLHGINSISRKNLEGKKVKL